jgi:hypothetical protein
VRQAKVRPEPHAANHAIDRGWLASARHDLAVVGAPWRDFKTIYGYLDTRKQADLHKFYQPSHQLSQQELVAHIETVCRADLSLAQRAGMYVGVLERLFLEVSKQQDISPVQAMKTIQTTYEATIKDPGSRDAQLLHTTEGVPLRLKNKAARLIARPILRPEPDIDRLVQASLDYYWQVQRDQDKTDCVPGHD